MSLDPDQIARWDTTAHELHLFMQSLVPSTEEEGKFFHVVTAIAGSAIPNYWKLHEAYSEDQQHVAAWACRNLLELAAFAEFVLESAQNATEFAEDRLLDGQEIAVLLGTLERWETSPAHPTSLDPIIDQYAQQMKAEGVTRKKFHRVSDIAKGALKKEFDTMNKLCSKFVHPSAWSLLTADRGPERFPQASEILFVYGVTNFMRVCAAFMPHIRQYGLRPKPQS
jgi:hypothetical protein